MSLDLRDVVLIAISVFISLMFLVGNNWLWSLNQPRYAVVDIQGVYNEKQKEFSALILKKEVSDQDHQKALDMAQRFGKDLEVILRALSKECNCILLNKSALIVSEGLRDYTQEIKIRLVEKK